jgi:anthranilate/para-aminobenzoate synthase component I
VSGQPLTTRQAELSLGCDTASLGRVVRSSQRAHLVLDGSGPFDDAWAVGPLVAIEPAVVLCVRGGASTNADRALRAIESIVTERRSRGGVRETGIALLLAYELFGGTAAAREPGFDLLALRVDCSARRLHGGKWLWTTRDGSAGRARGPGALGERLSTGSGPEPRAGARSTTRPSSSLPRETYLRAVERVGRHIARGDVYQANLCQRFEVSYAGDPFETWLELTRTSPAPRSAFLAAESFALASLSPETFLLERRPGVVETVPIKGTRPRGATAAEDRAAAAELLASEKDRAELLMIVDLERNDLSRVCDAGSVEVPEVAGLRSYAHVHHLVARVRGRLSAEVGLASLLEATFPGGSITGAPKIRAMEILRELEPTPRGFFTGSLLWFADDGSLESSILIRSWVFGRERAWLGAGGGIVADSDPESEWRESNHKARPLAAALGFAPEEAA